MLRAPETAANRPWRRVLVGINPQRDLMQDVGPEVSVHLPVLGIYRGNLLSGPEKGFHNSTVEYPGVAGRHGQESNFHSCVGVRPSQKRFLLLTQPIEIRLDDGRVEL